MFKNMVIFLGKKVYPVADRLTYLGHAVLIAMVLLTVTDIVLRRFFNSPLVFSYEITTFMLLVYVFCVGPYSFASNRSISIDVVTTGYPPKIRKVTEMIARLIGAILWGLIGWRTIHQALFLWKMGQISGLLSIPFFPFTFFVAFASLLLALVLLIQSFEVLIGDIK